MTIWTTIYIPWHSYSKEDTVNSISQRNTDHGYKFKKKFAPEYKLFAHQFAVDTSC
jgi:hypothetical protein